LQIPVDAIVNNGNMEELGAGTKGGVYRALLNLDGSGMCTIGLKTRQCRYSQKEKRDEKTSCANNNTKQPDEYQDERNGMRKEFMGAFLFMATRKAGIDLPSLIPTWGMVVDNDKQKPPSIVGENISYPHVVGMVMPLREMIQIKAVTDQNLTDIAPKTPLDLARMMLPAAEAFLFMNQLGMSSQHIGEHNMGLPTSTSEFQGASVYDFSYLSFLHGAPCLLDGNQSQACNICDKESLTHKHRHEKNWTSDYIFEKDCGTFGKIVKALKNMMMPHEGDAQAFQLLRDNFPCEHCRFKDSVFVLRNLIQEIMGDEGSYS
jgi:hypothetical protein